MQGNRPETGGHSDPMEMAAALNINRDTIIKQTAFSRLRVRHLHGRTDHVRIDHHLGRVVADESAGSDEGDSRGGPSGTNSGEGGHSRSLSTRGRARAMQIGAISATRRGCMSSSCWLKSAIRSSFRFTPIFFHCSAGISPVCRSSRRLTCVVKSRPLALPVVAQKRLRSVGVVSTVGQERVCPGSDGADRTHRQTDVILKR